MPGTPDIVVIGLRAVGFIASFQAAGAALFLALIGRRLTIIDHDTRRLSVTVAVLAVAATIAQHALGPARLTGAFGDVFDLSLQRFLLDSAAGTAHITRVAGLGLLIAATVAMSRVRLSLALSGAAITIVSFSLMGHTTTYEPGWLLRLLLFVHLIVVAFWFGSLLPLRDALRRESEQVALVVIRRFSDIAIRTVPLLFLSGLAIAVFLVGSLERLLTPYGSILLGKVAGFAFLLLLAAWNRWRLTPALHDDREGSANALRSSIAIEWLLVALILAATAALTSLFSPNG